ncbi:transporter substrate-binding domain-containing protein [Chitinibacter fontanus]|uniref:Transporter substrate-binding domain-containing protein n=1 Tax=Chitinibacter fontanus TaxID=1737446 RepID=A0A7D5V9U8_9NEIS|nr:ABC transporter substrate-binding protein [Chitinibacter fontanus]QLI81695.1 transporter substrate-binding domain-containing protein [Chitinibacter fontanus]
MRRLYTLLCFCGLTLSATLLAAPTLRIGLGESKLPYIDAEQRTGVEYEIISAIFQQAGLKISIDHLPNKRAQYLFNQGKLDAYISTAGQYASNPYIVYQNMAITLCERQIKLASMTDLARYQVGAFHNASQLLGDEFAKQASDKTRYTELAQQELLNRMLALGRIDVAVSDINIFQHFNQLQHRVPTAICPYALFPPTHYRLIFHNASLQARFNQALAQTLNSKLYEQLATKYKLSLERGRPYFKP